jgi:putative phosphoribosyl transferase
VRFADRLEAGHALAGDLTRFAGTDAVVLGLPRGGVPVAAVVAGELGLPWDVLVVAKVGVPWQPEVAMGAVGESGVTVRHAAVLSELGISTEQFEASAAEPRLRVQQRAQSLRAHRHDLSLTGRTALIVDDGLATGATAEAAVAVARAMGAARVVVAAPVGPADGLSGLAAAADELVVSLRASPFGAVGAYYDDFTAVSDAAVIRLLG